MSRPSPSPAARKVIVTCAITGSIHVPSQTPYLPITPDQIAERHRRGARRSRYPAPARARSRRTVSRHLTRMSSCSSCPHQRRHRRRHQHHHRRRADDDDR